MTAPRKAPRAKTAERASTALLALTVLLLAAIPVATLVGRGPGAAAPAESLRTARTRLEMATKVRYETADEIGDTRFDQLLGALVAGLDPAAPPDLVAALRAAEAARERERATREPKVEKGTRTSAKPTPDPAVDQNLVLAARAIARAEAETYLEEAPLFAGTARDWLMLAALGAAVGSLALARLERSRRTGERREIAAHIGADPSLADDGNLAHDVAVFVALAKSKAKRPDSPSRDVPPPHMTYPSEPAPARARVSFADSLEPRAPIAERSAAEPPPTEAAPVALVPPRPDFEVGELPSLPKRPADPPPIVAPLAEPAAPPPAVDTPAVPVAPPPGPGVGEIAGASPAPSALRSAQPATEPPAEPSEEPDPFAGLPFLPDPTQTSENPRIQAKRLLEIEILPLDAS